MPYKFKIKIHLYNIIIVVKNEDKIAYLSKIRLKDVIYGKHQFEIALSAIG